MQLIKVFLFLSILLAFQADAIRIRERMGNIIDEIMKTFPVFGDKNSPAPPPTSLQPQHSPTTSLHASQEVSNTTASQNTSTTPLSLASFPFIGVPVSIISRQSGYFLDVQVTEQLPNVSSSTIQEILAAANIHITLNATLQELGNELRLLLNGTNINQLPGLKALVNATNINQLIQQLQQRLTAYELGRGAASSARLYVKSQSCSLSQQWIITSDNNGFYYISSQASPSLVVTINPVTSFHGFISNGFTAGITINAALPSQKFTFESLPEGGNWWRIVSSSKSGANVVLAQESFAKGTPVIALPVEKGGANGQEWLIIRKDCSLTPTLPQQNGCQAPVNGASPSTSSSPIASSPPNGAGQESVPIAGYSSPSSQVQVGLSSPVVLYSSYTGTASSIGSETPFIGSGTLSSPSIGSESSPSSSTIGTGSSPLSSPSIGSESSPLSSTIGTGSLPLSSTIGTESSPISSPIGTESSPISSPTGTESSPISSPIGSESSPISSPIGTESSPISSPIGTESSGVEYSSPVVGYSSPIVYSSAVTSESSCSGSESSSFPSPPALYSSQVSQSSGYSSPTFVPSSSPSSQSSGSESSPVGVESSPSSAGGLESSSLPSPALYSSQVSQSSGYSSPTIVPSSSQSSGSESSPVGVYSSLSSTGGSESSGFPSPALYSSQVSQSSGYSSPTIVPSSSQSSQSSGSESSPVGVYSSLSSTWVSESSPFVSSSSEQYSSSSEQYSSPSTYELSSGSEASSPVVEFSSSTYQYSSPTYTSPVIVASPGLYGNYVPQEPQSPAP
jgi:hypothetical protein